MATTEHAAPGVNRARVAGLVLAGLAAAAIVAVVIGTRRPPQMGADEEAMRTVDALYTAVRERDEKRMGECERRLHGYRDASQLPPDAAAFLDKVIAKARGGGWESATEKLYDFMRVQRREGDPGEPPHPHPKPNPKGKKSG